MSAEGPQSEFQAVIARYQKVNSLSGNFVQNINSEELDYSQQLEGKFYFARPNWFRFEVSSPENQIVVGDSEVTWFYWPDSNLVRKSMPVGNPFFEILLNSSEETFRPESVSSEDGTTVLTLVPNDSLAAFARIWLRLGPQTHLIEGITIDDGLGTETKYSLTELRYNPRLPAKLFRFVPPEGAVVEE